jgi:outer membrane lipoprotein SlyB
VSPRPSIHLHLVRSMTPRRLATLLALLLACFARPAAAQDAGEEAQAEMRTGRWRVRVVAPSAGITELAPATLVQVRGDSMVLDFAGIRKTVAVTQITRLQRVEGIENRLVHTTVGALGGALVGFGAGELRRHWSISGDDQRPIFAGVGALLGALAGSRLLQDRWQEVPGYAAVVPTERGDALALGVELRF